MFLKCINHNSKNENYLNITSTTFNQNVVNDLFQNTKKSLIKIKYRNNNIQNLRQDNPN